MYAYPRVFEALYIWVATALFFLRRRRTELMIALGIAILEVVGDQVAQTAAGLGLFTVVLAANITYATLVGAGILTLHRQRTLPSMPRYAD